MYRAYGYLALLRRCGEILVAYFLFSGRLERKKGLWWKSCLFLGAEVAISWLFHVAVEGVAKSWQIESVLILMTAVLVIWVWTGFTAALPNAVLWGFLALLAQSAAHSAYTALWILVGEGFSLPSVFHRETVLGYGIYYLIFAGVYWATYSFAGRRAREKTALEGNFVDFVPVMVSVLFAIPLISEVRAYLRPWSLPLALLAFLQVVYSVTAIAHCHTLLSRVQAQLEAIALQRTQEMEHKQFEQLQGSMESLRLKCHDLKYLLSCLRETGKVDRDRMEETEQALEVYESIYHSGNTALDLILSDRRLHCVGKKIDFTCMARAEKLAFMEPSDIYSLFCNALDNAIEYEEGIEGKEKFIHVSVRDEDRLLLLHIENYYEGPDFVGEELKTGKGDTAQHGYGLKSIRRTVEKYGGQMELRAEDGLFSLNIVFPLAE